VLDCIPKGFSFTEIIWDTSEGQWQPLRLERRDPRWFRFDKVDLCTPRMLDDFGQEQPLPGGKFVFAQIKAKSGLPLRSGLARVALWGWMFKAFTMRDWAIFSQTYGQPLRLGKWGPGASEADKDTLFRAVAEIAGDCAAIIPESMSIDFVEASNVGTASDLYEKRVTFLDQQISKAVLGQTATTDAVTGGLGSGTEHREVQEDIERSDAKALSATLTRDLAVPFVQLNHGPQTHYPRIQIKRPEPEDLVALANGLNVIVPLGVRVKESQIRDKFGLEEPADADRILIAPGQNAPISPDSGPVQGEGSKLEHSRSILKRFSAPLAGSSGKDAPQASEALYGAENGPRPFDALADRLADEAAPIIEQMLDQLQTMLDTAQSLEEAREMWLAAYPDLDSTAFAELLAEAMIAAQAGGLAETSDG